MDVCGECAINAFINFNNKMHFYKTVRRRKKTNKLLFK